MEKKFSYRVILLMVCFVIFYEHAAYSQEQKPIIEDEKNETTQEFLSREDILKFAKKEVEEWSAGNSPYSWYNIKDPILIYDEGNKQFFEYWAKKGYYVLPLDIAEKLEGKNYQAVNVVPEDIWILIDKENGKVLMTYEQPVSDSYRWDLRTRQFN